jgi:ABC-type Zn uptake system ZnuABC Zn-binding protein ZnuA
MKRVCVLIAIIVTIFFAGCASTKEASGVWYDKEKIQGKVYDNFFVIVMTADIEARVRLENDVAATIVSRGHKAIKSYEVLPADLKDPKPPAVDALIEKIKASDCDAVFVVSLLDKNDEIRYTTGGTHYTMRTDYSWAGTFFGYYSHYYTTVSSAGYYSNDKTYFMQSNLFDKASQQLMFSVQSEIFNPSSLASGSRTYISTLLTQLDKAKLLKK